MALNILVVGAGAIGSLLGGRLALAGHAVTMVGRPWLQAAVEREGLTIVTEGEPRTVTSVRVLTSTGAALAGGQAYDYLLLTPKAYSLSAALDEVRAATPTPPPIVTFQNGLGSEEMAAERLSADRVIAATLTTPVEVLGEARIGTWHKGGVGLARWLPASPDPAPLASLLREAGFATALYDDPLAMKWSKLLLNMVGNATSAILGWLPQRTMADARLYNIELDAVQEARRIMRALDIATVNLPGYPARFQFALLDTLPRWLSRPIMVRLVAGSRGGKMPSLFLGLESGRQVSEVEVMNGAIVQAGDRLGIPTPVNRALTQLVRALARGEQPRAAFHHNPEALVEWVSG